MSAPLRRAAIVPCSKEKAWDLDPARGAVPAGEAYVSDFHRLTRRYAEAHAGRVLILSAKHGLLDLDDLVPGPYDVTFSRPGDPVVSRETLAAQARAKGLEGYEELWVVCPDDYLREVELAVAGSPVRVVAPLRGMGGLEDMARFLERTLGG